MTLKVRLLVEAVAELEDSSSWYEERRDGLGRTFVTAVDRTIDFVSRWPEAGALVDGIADELGVRRMPIETFPYYLAYVRTEDGLIVLAVAHGRRRPRYWIDRTT